MRGHCKICTIRYLESSMAVTNLYPFTGKACLRSLPRRVAHSPGVKVRKPTKLFDLVGVGLLSCVVSFPHDGVLGHGS